MSQGEKELPKGWKWETLEQVVDLETNAVIPSAGILYAYVGLENIESQTGEIINCKDVDGATIESQKYFFDSNHVLYGKLRPYLNKVALPK
jgi:type I restriction enzyme S subunit